MITLNDFTGISIRGRVAFCLNGLNYFMLKHYKDEAWGIFHHRFSDFFKLDYLDEWDEETCEMSPSVVEAYDKYVPNDFDFLEEELFFKLKKFYASIDVEVKEVVNLLHQMAGVYLYSTPDIECTLMMDDFKTISHFLWMKGCLSNVEDYKSFSYNECGGWGREGDYTFSQ